MIGGGPNPAPAERLPATPEEVVPLPDIAVRNACPAEKAVRLFDGGGLYLGIRPADSFEVVAREHPGKRVASGAASARRYAVVRRRRAMPTRAAMNNIALVGSGTPVSGDRST